MGIWTNVKCVMNIDSKTVINDFTKYFGKECGCHDLDYGFHEYTDQYLADLDKAYELNSKEWDAYKEHPEDFLPVGSEGSLRMKTRLQTRVKDTLYPYRYKVEIYGGLRDHYDGEEIIDHIKDGINKLRKDKDLEVCMKVHAESYNYLDGCYEYNFVDSLFRKRSFYRDIE